MKKIYKKSGALALFISLGLNLWAGNLLTVTSQSDSGDGSLRAMIESASDGDSIVIPDYYNIALESDLSFDKSLVINGQGATVAVKSPSVSTFRVFTIGSTTSTTIKTVSLYNLHLEGGVSSVEGGVVYVNLNHNFTMKNCSISKGRGTYAGGLMIKSATGMTTLLENCTFSENENTLSTGNAGACALKGTATLIKCIFNENKTPNNGSAVAAYGPTTLTDCYFYNNSSAGTAGAAVINFAAATGVVALNNCTFESNSNMNATTGVGGFAINNKLATSTLTNCTFYGNSGISAGAVWNGKGYLNMTNCTFTGNACTGTAGAGAFTNAAVADSKSTLTNCLFAYNYGSTGLSDVFSGDLGSISGSNNILGNTSGILATENTVSIDYNSEPNVFAELTAETNKCGKPGDNGGFTKTVAISENSIARSAGASNYGDPNLVPDYDQRGLAHSATPCIGAFEYGQITELSNPAKVNNLLIVNASGCLTWNESVKIQSIELINISGQTVVFTLNPENGISTRNLSSGLYLVKIMTEKGLLIQKIFVR